MKARLPQGMGGGAPSNMNGKKEVVKVSLKPEVVDPEDVELLEDMIAGAVNEAIRAVEADAQQVMGGITGGLRAPGLM